MEHPFAITLDGGTSLANHTGSWRTVRPDYVASPAAVQPRLPGGRGYSGLALMPRPATIETAWRALTQNNPLPAVMGRVCYHPCESACNRAAQSIPPSASIRSSVSSATWPSRRAGDSRRRARNPARRCWSSAPGRRAFRRPIIWRGSATRSTIKEAGPRAGGMMRFGIPKYRLPRDDPRRGSRRASSISASSIELQCQGRRHLAERR